LNPQLLDEVTRRLVKHYGFKEKKDWLRGGKCPDCSKNELYASAKAPWVLRCGRTNNCGHESRIKDIYDDLFDNWSDRFKRTESDPNAAADAYLSSSRGLNVSTLRGAYSEELFRDSDSQHTSATVRFPLPGGSYWERLIDRPQRFGKMKARFAAGKSYQGHAWVHPTLHDDAVTKRDKLWIVEGIFDSCALIDNSISAVSAMSCNNYPSLYLKRLADLCQGKKRPTLVWALDGDKAGREYTIRWVKRAREDGWKCEAATIPQSSRDKVDWNDQHLAGRLAQKDVEEYLYQGSLLIAATHMEKARLMYARTGMSSFFYEHDNRLYWFDLDLKAYDKAMQQLQDKGEDEELDDPQLREKALAESCDNVELANCYPHPLYFQANPVTDESWYYYRVSFPHAGATIKSTFAGGSLSSASEFKKRLLSIAPGAVWTGTSQQLDRIIKVQLFGIKTVQTIDYIGYAKDHKTYVFGDLAVKEGSVHELNDEDYFDIGRLNLKTLTHSPQLTISRDRNAYSDQWLDLVWACFGAKGLVALTFWFGSIFAEQIREKQKSYPFFELVGEAGSGKSTLVEFLWKLVGRRDYEGFDPSKSTPAARSRNFAQVSNLPVVLIESDREGDDAKKKFDWDELKTAYNGRAVRSTGVKNSGNETREPPFRATVVISQNARVEASEAIMQRICHITVDRSAHTPETRAKALKLEQMPVDVVSYFLILATRSEAKTMETINSSVGAYEMELLANPHVKTTRIAKNHGQLLAVFKALTDILPFTSEQKKAVHDEVHAMAVERQQTISSDHKVVQEFWERFEYIDSWDAAAPRLNHSRNPAEIAVNLNHFQQLAAEMRLQVPVLADLKKYLRGSRTRKFVDVKTVNSALYLVNETDESKGRSVKCWVFQRGPNEQPKKAAHRGWSLGE